MSREKQIEEMAADLCACHTEFCTDPGEIYTDYTETARRLIDKGYRKQEQAPKKCPWCGQIHS